MGYGLINLADAGRGEFFLDRAIIMRRQMVVVLGFVSQRRAAIVPIVNKRQP
jgi:flagellar biosynthesis component FlhA